MTPTHAFALLTALSCLGLAPLALADDGDDDTSTFDEARSSRSRDEGWYRTSRLLPDYDDIALGFDAVPFLGYVGNAFNNSTFNAPSLDYPFPDQAVMGKYFLDPNTAVRARVRVTTYNNVNREAVLEDGQDPDSFDPSQTVQDTYSSRFVGVSLAGGLEKRRGFGRLQGIYGAEASLGVSRLVGVYTYGNDLDEDNPTPTTSNFSSGSYAASSRVLESTSGLSISLGARGFAGAEFFFAPRICVGGEFGYQAGVTLQTAGHTDIERYDYTEEDTVTNRYEQPGDTYLGLNTDRLSGALYLLVHF